MLKTISKFVIRNQDVINAVRRASLKMSNSDNQLSDFIYGLIFRLGFNQLQVLHVRKVEIIEDSQLEDFLNRPRICVGLELTPDITEYLQNLTYEELDRLHRDILIEAIDLGLDLNLIDEFDDSIRRAIYNPHGWTQIPDIVEPFSQRR